VEAVFVDLATEPAVAGAALLFGEQGGDLRVVGADETGEQFVGRRIGDRGTGAKGGERRGGGGGNEEGAAVHEKIRVG